MRAALDSFEAARLLDVCPGHVVHLAREGKIRAERVGRSYVIDRGSAEAYAEQRDRRKASMRPTPPRPAPPDALPATPLLRVVDRRGGRRAVGVARKSAEERTLQRAARDGWVSQQMADRLATQLLGLTPWEVWG